VHVKAAGTASPSASDAPSVGAAIAIAGPLVSTVSGAVALPLAERFVGTGTPAAAGRQRRAGPAGAGGRAAAGAHAGWVRDRPRGFNRVAPSFG
jgi:hypothetical protein